MDIKNEVERQYNILKRGCEEVINEVEFKQKLEKSIKNPHPFSILLRKKKKKKKKKIENNVTLRKLKQFQDIEIGSVITIKGFVKYKLFCEKGEKKKGKEKILVKKYK